MSSLRPIALYHNAVYYPNYRASPTSPPSSLPLDTISHIFYAFASVRQDGTVYLSNPATDIHMDIDGTQGALRACSKLKRDHPYLKCILSVGGAGVSNEIFANAAADEHCRARFGWSSRQLVDEYNFDGIDVDWEYPEPGQQAENYIQLMAVLRAYLPMSKYVVTTALPAGEWCLSRFDLPRLALTVDLLNLMAYDFVGNWGSPVYSGHHAQLYNPLGGPSGSAAVRYAIDHHFPAKNILLGVPAYGWSFPHCNDINQPTSQCSSFDYSQLPRPGTQELTDEACVATYCVGAVDGFVSYDNPRSVQTKARWAKSTGLGGIFFWHALADAKGARSLIYSSYMALHT